MNLVTKNNVRFFQSMPSDSFAIAVRELFKETNLLLFSQAEDGIFKEDSTVGNIDVDSVEWGNAKQMWSSLVDNHTDIVTIIKRLQDHKKNQTLFCFIYSMANKNDWFEQAMLWLEHREPARFKEVKRIFIENLVPDEQSDAAEKGEILDATQTC